MPTSLELGLPTDHSNDHCGYVHQAVAHMLLLNDQLTPDDFCKATWTSTYVNLGECAHWCMRTPKHVGPCMCPCHSQSYPKTKPTP